MPTAAPEQANRAFLSDLCLAVAWLLVIALINQTPSFTIYSLFPYLAPVIFLGWRYGVAWGFVASALATFAAIPAGYPEQHPEALMSAAVSTYFKLSIAVAGACLGRAYARSRGE